METRSVSVTEAARRFSECVSRVRYQNVRFVLEKNGTPVAQLVPWEGKTCTGRDLAAVLGSQSFERAERRAWGRELRERRAQMRAPQARWR